MKKKKNVYIDIYRVYFTMVVMLNHLRLYSAALPFGGAYPSVDFFFILSGFLMYSSIGADEDSVIKGVWIYLKKRYIRLLKPILICNVIMLLISMIFISYSLPIGIWGFVRETSMIEIFSISSKDRFNPAGWYLGVMLMASVIIYAIELITKKIKNGRIVANCVMAGFIIGYLILIYHRGNGNIYIQYASVLDWAALLRGLSGIAAGVIVAQTTDKEIPWVLPLAIIPVYIYYLMWKDGYNRFDVVLYMVVVLGVFLCKNARTLPFEGGTGVVDLVAKSAVWVYLIHYPIVRILCYYRPFDALDWKVLCIVFLILVWGIAIIMELINKYIKKMLNR